ncbi:hypothetical protein HYC85_024474 [Camellia sinensis]|uniref:Peptidase C14 caspase domain-containing protein n=1 Tax=Camellia sinensis TaxID=4442 RepID=A0A7J7GBU4_CAMSI|nr:hypothetical protein HYC85_024474 [Camellia sinensis]
MARQRCNCGVLLAVPNGAQTFRCPVCYAIIVCSNNYGYVPPAASNNGYNVPVASNNNGYMVPAANNSNGIPNNYYPNYNRTDYGHNNQQPLWQLPQLLPLSVHGRRRAVLIGICYHGQKKSLKGSINDARSMKNFLVNRLGFPNESVLVLTVTNNKFAEEENDPYRIPTKRNIRMAMKWLVQGCQSGDSLVFHFSGHASQVPDLDGDEVDGYDEALCPVDYQTEGNILDDEINATIVRPLPHGAKLHAIIDSSFSGTILDLPFICRMNQQGYYAWEDHRVSTAYKGTSGGTAICFSACDDDQNSGDTMAFTGDTATGAMTYSFIQAMENECGLTYGRLLPSIRNKICEAHKRLYGPCAPPTSQTISAISSCSSACFVLGFVCTSSSSSFSPSERRFQGFRIEKEKDLVQSVLLG